MVFYMLRFFNKRLHNRKGFTLIELIVVIAILAILALIAIPRLFGFTEQARQATDKESAALVANAAAMYVAQHGEDRDAAGDLVLTNDTLTLAVLEAADLLLPEDYALTSAGYGGPRDLADDEITYDPATRTVTVIMLADDVDPRGATDYTVVK